MHHFSNMSSNLELFLVKSDKENLINDQNLEGSSNSQCKKEENSDNHEIEKEECSRTSSSSPSASEAEEKLKEKDEEDGFRTSLPSSSSSEAEEKLKEKDEEEDGFKTPTSLDHKISVLTCPLAPKKMKQCLKRRAAPYNDQYFSCRQLPLDLSKEVELLLFPTKHIPLSDSYSAKKIRRENLEPK